MSNDNIEVLHQHQVVVAWVRLRHTEKLKETKINFLRTVSHKKSKLFLCKNPNNKSNKMILIIIVIII